MKIRAAVIQFDVRTGDAEHNLRRAEALINDAAQRGGELLLLPELWNTGFDLQHVADLAQDMQGEAISLLRRLAARQGLTIIGGSIIESRHGKYYNMLPVINAEGTVIAKYRKTHLFTHYLREHLYFAPGGEWASFDYQNNTGSVNVGLGICYDLRFPELFRNLALRGARLFAVPAGWPAPRIREFELFCRARAAENRCFLLAANYTDTVNNEYGGNSVIVSPLGDILAKGGNEEGVFLAELDLSLLEQADIFNSLADRQPFIDEIDNNLL